MSFVKFTRVVCAKAIGQHRNSCRSPLSVSEPFSLPTHSVEHFQYRLLHYCWLKLLLASHLGDPSTWHSKHSAHNSSTATIGVQFSLKVCTLRIFFIKFNSFTIEMLRLERSVETCKKKWIWNEKIPKIIPTPQQQSLSSIGFVFSI